MQEGKTVKSKVNRKWYSKHVLVYYSGCAIKRAQREGDLRTSAKRKRRNKAYFSLLLPSSDLLDQLNLNVPHKSHTQYWILGVGNVISMVEHVLSMCGALASIPSPTKEKSVLWVNKQCLWRRIRTTFGCGQRIPAGRTSADSLRTSCVYNTYPSNTGSLCSYTWN